MIFEKKARTVHQTCPGQRTQTVQAALVCGVRKAARDVRRYWLSAGPSSAADATWKRFRSGGACNAGAVRNASQPCANIKVATAKALFGGADQRF